MLSEIAIASEYLKKKYPIQIEPPNGRIGRSGLEGKSDLRVNLNGEGIYFEITQENYDVPDNSLLTISRISGYITEEIKRQDLLPWRTKIDARVVDKNKVLSHNWSSNLLKHLKRSSFKANTWKEFNGIKYAVKYCIPDEPVFSLAIPITNSKKYFIRKIKEEATQIPRNAKGVVVIALSSSLNIDTFTNYAYQILKRNTFENIIAIIVWYKKDYRIIRKNFQFLDFLSIPFNHAA